MAALVNHGGHCCGVRHIYGMDGTTVAELDRHITALERETNVVNDVRRNQAGRLIEIILSSRQVGDVAFGGRTNGWAPCVERAGGWPAVMAARGFRLVSRFLNANSNKECFIFHRVPTFLSIEPRDLPFTWDHNGFTPPPARAAAPVVDEFPIYSRVQYRNAESEYNGRSAEVTSHIADGRVRILFPNGHSKYVARTMLRLLNQQPAGEPVAAPAAPTRVLQLWQNVFADGRRGGMYPLIGGAREAAPRCRRIDRVEYYSDGTSRIIENVAE